MARPFNYMYEGEIFAAATDCAVVDYLRKGAFDPCESEADFMADMASRVAEGEAEIRCDTAEHFVADLLTNGIIKPGRSE